MQETRRTFYAGAWAIMTALWNISGEKISEDEGADRLEEMHQECPGIHGARQKGSSDEHDN